MDNLLADILIERNLLKQDMEVTARYYSVDVGGLNKILVRGDFYIMSHTKVEKDDVTRWIFMLKSTRDGTLQKVYGEAIEQIEGMPPERFASVYNIKPDGSAASNKKKRGRKSKKVLLEMKLAQMNKETQVEMI